MREQARPWSMALGLTLAVTMTLTLVSCGGSSPEPDPAPVPRSPAAGPSPARTVPALPRIQLPVQPGATVEGLVDVDGHDIYARCAGAGTPTVVYFTGWAPDLDKRGVAIIPSIEAADEGHHRFCSYERRNTGRSEPVDGTQSPEDIVADVDGVLGALGEKGPFVLLGASFGGLIAGAYAVAHPDRTAAILLLDAGIPDDYVIEEHHDFNAMCLKANRDADANDSLEKIDNCRLAKWAYDRRAQEPDVPLIYLAASTVPERDNAGDEAVRKAFVRRWSPGVWKVVTAEHWMDESDPALVVKYLDQVIALTS